MKKVITIIVLLMNTLAVLAEMRREVSIYAGGGLSTLNFNTEFGKASWGAGGTLGVGWIFFWSDHWGFYTGIEAALYNSKFLSSEFEGQYITSEGTGNNFTFHYKLQNYKESQRAITLNLPIMLQCHGERVYTHFNTSEANLTSWGTKVDRGLNLDNFDDQKLKEYGFGNDYTAAANDGSLQLKMPIFASAELGVKWQLDKVWSLYTSVYVDYGLNDVSNAISTHIIEWSDHYFKKEPYKSNTVVNYKLGEDKFADKANLFAVGLKVTVFAFSTDIFKRSPSVYVPKEIIEEEEEEEEEQPKRTVAERTVPPPRQQQRVPETTYGDQSNLLKDMKNDEEVTYVDYDLYTSKPEAATPAPVIPEYEQIVQVVETREPAEPTASSQTQTIETTTTTTTSTSTDFATEIRRLAELLAQHNRRITELEKFAAEHSKVPHSRPGSSIDDYHAHYPDDYPGVPDNKELAKLLRPLDGYSLRGIVLPQRAMSDLREKVKILLRYPNLNIIIEGYTCDVGTVIANYEISIQRAKLIRKYLIEHGIDSDRILGIEPKGAEEPVAPNNNTANRMKNRRVVLRIMR